MKKILIALLSVIMVLGLTGCSDKGNSNEKPVSGESPLIGDPNKTFYMVAHKSGLSYWQQVYRGFEDAGKLFGVKTVLTGAVKSDVIDSITSFEQVVAQKPAGIAVTSLDGDAFIDPINKAMEQNIPIVSFDMDSPRSNRVAFIGTENFDAGAEAAHYVASKLPNGGKVAAVTVPKAIHIVKRTDGFTETLASTYKNITVAKTIAAGEDESQTTTNISALLSNNPDLNYLLTTTSMQTSAALQAISEAGLEGKVKVIGFDTDRIILDAIGSGKVEAAISQAPWVQGFWSMVYLYFMDANVITSAEDWMANGYPSIPVTANSGIAIVTIDNYKAFYTSDN